MSSEDMIWEIYLRIVGDGSDDKPGLEKRVDRLETKFGIIQWLSASAFGVAVTYVVTWVIQKFKGSQ